MNNRYFIVTSLLVLILLPFSAGAQDPATGSPIELLPAGSIAPPVSLPDILGNQVNLSKHLGKSPVVLSFWSIYCDSCVDEMLSLQKLEDKYQGEGLVIMAVNEDIRVPKERIRRFIEIRGLLI